MERPSATHQGFDVAAAEGQAFLPFQEFKDLGVALLVADQELFGLGLADAGGPGKSLGSHAINHPKVDRFAQAPLLIAHLAFIQ